MTNKQKNNVKVISGAIVLSSLAGTPVMAQDANPSSGIQQVQDTVTSIGGIASSAVGIVVLAMGVRLAIKQVNRVMTKG